MTDRLVAAEIKTVDVAEMQLRPQTLGEFVGQP